MGKTLRAAGMRALRACVAARPSLVTALVPLLPHAGSDDVADALADGFERAFEETGETERGSSRVTERESPGRSARKRRTRNVVGYPRGRTGGRGAEGEDAARGNRVLPVGESAPSPDPVETTRH